MRDRERVSSALTEPGDIYVIGNPLHLYLLGRGQAISHNGWSPEQWTEAQWGLVVDQLQVTRPPYLMIENDYRHYVTGNPTFGEFVLRQYRVLMATRDGVWYEVRSGSG